MSAETIRRNAAAAESRTRVLVLVIQRAAKEQPGHEILKIAAETADLILELGQNRAKYISREIVDTRLGDFRETASELEEQATEGLRPVGDALESLDRLHAGEAVWLAEHELAAWEAAESEMRDLVSRAGLRDGT